MLKGILVQDVKDDKSYVVVTLGLEWIVGGKPFVGTIDEAITSAVKAYAGKPILVADGTGITIGQVRSGKWNWSSLGRIHYRGQSEVYE